MLRTAAVAGPASGIGRAAWAEAVCCHGGGWIHSVCAVAGMAVPMPASVAVNSFGTLATPEGLRFLLSGRPRRGRPRSAL